MCGFRAAAAETPRALAALVDGMPAQEAVRRLRGIRCGAKPTSCPDQLAIAIEQAQKE